MRNVFILFGMRSGENGPLGVFDSESDAYDHIANVLKLVQREALDSSPYLTLHSLCMHIIQVPYHQSKLGKINTWLEL